MSLVLELPPELESELAAEAGQLGLSLPDYVLRLLATGRGLQAQPRTGAELVKYWENESLVGARPEIAVSPSHARDLRDRAQRRPRP